MAYECLAGANPTQNDINTVLQTAIKNCDNNLVCFCGWELQTFMRACDDMIENLDSIRHALSAIHGMIDSTGEAANVRGLVAVGSLSMFATWSSLSNQLKYFKDDSGYVDKGITLKTYDNDIFWCKDESFEYLLKACDGVIENMAILNSSLGSIVDTLQRMPKTRKAIKLISLVKIGALKFRSDLSSLVSRFRNEDLGS